MARLLPDDANFGPKAPITEGLLDLRLANGVYLEPLRDLNQRFVAEFPNGRTKFELSGQIKSDGDDLAMSPVSSGVHGFIRGNEQHEAIQLNLSGFAYSKLAPYTDWLTVRNRTNGLWRIFADALTPGPVRRLAVRYINQLVPPEPWEDPADWVRVVPTPPAVPRTPTTPRDFQVKTVIVHPDWEARAVVTSACTTGMPTGTGRGILLDIDVACDVDLPADSPEIWQKFDLLRDFKNDLFFGSITPRTRGLLL